MHMRRIHASTKPREKATARLYQLPSLLRLEGEYILDTLKHYLGAELYTIGEYQL